MTSAEQLPSRMIGVAKRIPKSLALLEGPASGTVILPNRLAWSGPSDFDVDNPAQRRTLYCLLIDCGQVDDVVAYMHAEHLRDDWPRIRRSTSRQMIALWETLHPELAAVE